MNATPILHALIAWAKSKGMKPDVDTMTLGISPSLMTTNGLTTITLPLLEQYDADPLVPNVDFLLWRSSHPGSVTGYQHQLWQGKVKPQVRGGWVDFICPKGV